MKTHSRFAAIVLMLAALALSIPAAQQTATQAPSRTPDVIYVPTPQEVVVGMLKLAKVGPGDVVYDLGSGDGRIPITAVKEFGAARGIGIDIDPQRIAEANANAQAAGVTDRVKFLNQDLFTSNISDATVVTLYLLPTLNLKLLPKLNKDLKPGTRVVSHSFDFGDQVPPIEKMNINGRTIYYWTIPIPMPASQ
jgi:predicted RNA methylase